MKNEIIAYSSVRGSLHAKNGIANQDAYLVRKYSFGTVLVVADGLGSKSHSDIGSQAVCKAVCKAVQVWVQYKNSDIRLILPLIHSFWGMEIYPYKSSECATTCLFVLILKSGEVFAGQLGDGDIFLEIDSEMHRIKYKDDEFTNFTSCMGGSTLKEWVLKSFHARERIRIVVMTDGVSETLIPTKKEEFIHYLWKVIIGEMCSADRNRSMFRILNNWNVTNAGDDRTLVVYEKI